MHPREQLGYYLFRFDMETFMVNDATQSHALDGRHAGLVLDLLPGTREIFPLVTTKDEPCTV